MFLPEHEIAQIFPKPVNSNKYQKLFQGDKFQIFDLSVSVQSKLVMHQI